MAFPKGHKLSGSRKGIPNKVTADVKAAILEAFEEAGGVKYLTAVARDNPQTFCALLGKVLPTQITGAGDGPILAKWTVELVRPDSKAPAS